MEDFAQNIINEDGYIVPKKNFSERNLRILQLHEDGKNPKQIGGMFGISANYVRVIINNLRNHESQKEREVQDQ